MTTPPPSECPTNVALLVTERHHQVPNPARVRAQGVVPSRLGRLAVAQQIRGDHGEAGGQVGHHSLPRGRGGGDAVDEHDRWAAAGAAVRDAMPVEQRFLELELLVRQPPGGWGARGRQGQQSTNDPVRRERCMFDEPREVGALGDLYANVWQVAYVTRRPRRGHGPAAQALRHREHGGAHRRSDLPRRRGARRRGTSRISMGARGGLIVELIEPVGGEVDFYRRFLPQDGATGLGFHHLATHMALGDDAGTRSGDVLAASRPERRVHGADPRPGARRVRRHHRRAGPLPGDLPASAGATSSSSAGSSKPAPDPPGSRAPARAAAPGPPPGRSARRRCSTSPRYSASAWGAGSSTSPS